MSRQTTITAIDAWEVLDSRGTPTVACEVRLAGGGVGMVSVPSGASTGRHEAHELRDGGVRYGGRGVQRAVQHIRTHIGLALAGFDAADQEATDAALAELDGSSRFERLGANAVLAVSLATALAAADAERTPLYRRLAGSAEPLLPLPMFNISSGGAHAGGVIDVQDFLAVPVGATTFAEAIELAWRVRRGTALLAEDRGFNTALVADEGGLAFPLAANRDALELLTAGIERAGLAPGDDIAIAIDVAAGQFHREGVYALSAEGRRYDAAGLIEELASWTADFPVVSIEDPLDEDDDEGWVTVSRRLRGIQLLGDDLFATDLSRLDRGIAAGVANAVLVKPNQNGTLTGAAQVTRRAQAAGYATVISARSGETEDSWLADLAVGWRAGQIKVGSTMRSERTAKWNRLLRIERELGAKAVFAGNGPLRRSRS